MGGNKRRSENEVTHDQDPLFASLDASQPAFALLIFGNSSNINTTTIEVNIIFKNLCMEDYGIQCLTHLNNFPICYLFGPLAMKYNPT